MRTKAEIQVEKFIQLLFIVLIDYYVYFSKIFKIRLGVH